MAAVIHYGGREITNLDDGEVADILAAALVASETGTFMHIAVERDDGADVFIFGPGIPVSAEVASLDEFRNHLSDSTDEYRRDGLPGM